MATRNIHLVGSVGLQNAETVFRTLAEIVGPGARRYPDGETGVRYYWLIWQGRVFAEHPDLEFDHTRAPLNPGAKAPDKHRIREGVDPSRIEFPPIGYAQEALKSYELFRQLRADGVIPDGVRFQVSLPTPAAVVSTFVAPEQAASVEPAYEGAMIADLETIIDNIPAEELAIQWDICIEIVAHDKGMPIYLPDPFAHVSEAVPRLMGLIPEAVDAGIHLCYGDPGHKHIIEPIDLGTSVQFANTLCANSPRSLSWVHMPVPRDRNDDAYFAPLEGLDIGSAELSLGLVHHTDGLQGTKVRMATAEKFVSDFGIATECGFGRRPPETIPTLLTIHSEASAL